MLHGILQLDGHEVIEAADGVTALELSTTGEDVVLLDVMMPGLDGFGVLAQLQDRGLSRPHVIMLTAKSGELDRQEALSLGAEGFITKPFDVDDVLREIKRVLSESEEQIEAQRDHEFYMSRLISLLEDSQAKRDVS